MSNRYQKSQDLLKRALKVTPLGSQTFSKSYLQYPHEAAPLFLEKGEGGCVWDVDGNKYVDMVCGLLPVILGYQDPDVDTAIQRQLKKGISLSLSTELEVQLAERLTEIIPCADMVRFAKNGSDVTTAAIRLARAFTQRDRIAVCGYHGWHDWYVGSTVRNDGVPDCVAQLTHRFEFNNLASLQQLFEQYPNEFAAVIMEPMNTVEPEPGFLNAVKNLAHEYGALFILDEIITGFRFSLGGAQSVLNVIPDLATFGKAMGNGMPISAVVGRSDVMSLLQDVFVSGTFGGEALSMAAALAVIDKMQQRAVIQDLWEKGTLLAERVCEVIKNLRLDEVFILSGMAPWMILTIHDYQGQPRELIKTIFMREMLNHGVLIQSSHNICYAHTLEDIEVVVMAYEKTLHFIADCLRDDNLQAVLQGPVLKPVFSVR